MKKMLSLLVLLAIFVSSAACTTEVVEVVDVVEHEAVTTTNTNQNMATAAYDADTADPPPTVTVEPVQIDIEYENNDLSPIELADDATMINLSGDTITTEGPGVTVNDSTVTITDGGTYRINGSLNDGQIIVETQAEDTVILVLDNAEIYSSTSAPIYVNNADKVIITLAEGSTNTVTDGASYVFAGAETDEPNAAIFSKDDLTINGTGALIVNANYNNGIASKDDLKITGGEIIVNAVNDGIKGRDSLVIHDGSINITAGGDGLQSNNEEDAEKGFVLIEGGTLDITAGLDGIQAETVLQITGGELAVIAGQSGSYQSGESAKGLKASVEVNISGGMMQITSRDDAIHSNTNITISGGEFLLATADDGIHADENITINDGTITIVQSYEAIESAVIIINDGNLHLVASDDGINVSNGVGGGRPGALASSEYYFEINGGYIFIDADGDGLDANGMGTLNDGTVLVNGPTENMNGAIDVDGMLVVNGGYLIAVGSAGMAQSPSEASTQFSVLQMFSSTQRAGTTLHIVSDDGQAIATFTPTKDYQTVVLSSPELKQGGTYHVYIGGSASGTETDGLYSDVSYSGGTEAASFTVSSMVTGASTGMRPGGGNRQRP